MTRMMTFIKRRAAVVLAIAVAAALLTATGAAATETNWRWYLRAGADPQHGNGIDLTTGTDLNSLDTREPSDTAVSFLPTVVANVACYNPSLGASPSLFHCDMRAPLGTVTSTSRTQVWDLRVWAMPDFSGNTLWLGWWSGSVLGPVDRLTPDTIGGADYTYTLEVYSDPTGQHQGYKWSRTQITDTEFSEANSLTWTGSFPKGDASYAVDNAIKIRLTVAPSTPGDIGSVPEPSSLLALATGIAGAGSSLLRRRKQH